MSKKGEARGKKLTSVFSISHDKDVDGLCAAAIVARYAKQKNLEFDVLLTDYGSFEYAFSKVAGLRDTLIVVTDLGLDENYLDAVEKGLSRAISQNCRVVWLDHHEWSKEAIKTIIQLERKPIVKINHDFCAAEIVYKVLMPRDLISGELAAIAHDTDFNERKILAANALTDAVSVIRFSAIDKRHDITDSLKPLLFALSENGIAGVWDSKRKKLRDNLLAKQVHHYRKDKAKKMKKAFAGHCDQEIKELLVRIVEIPSGVTTTDFGTYLANPDNLEIDGKKYKPADLLITLSQGGMLGFRRSGEKALCNAAAKIFKGGGHPYAAGGEYGLYDDFGAVCADIFNTLSKDTSWITEESG
ncbi:MAG: hypothetical protein GF411_16950 [Candidatus Lokiarchaeota archaeon]|nr:hypothetical protein [Candidatus Lokiarchaeota archaeon]